MPNINQRHKYHLLLYIFKLFYYKEPSYLFEMFTFLKNVSNRNTRSHEKFLLAPRSCSAVYDKSFVLLGTKLWNDLPYSICDSKSLSIFKSRVLKRIMCTDS